MVQEDVCSGLSWYRRGLAQANAAGGKAGVVGVVASPEPAASSRGVETGDVGLAIVVDKMVVRAQKKFDQLDTDGNGALEGEELVGLAQWVWSSFHPGGEALNEEQKADESSKLLRRLDANGDGQMGFDEFVGWFRRTCAGIERYRRGLAQANAAGGKAGVVGVVASPEPAASSRGVETGDVGLAIVVDKMVVRAQKRFDQLDTDGNGALGGEELVGLAQWVWSSFHPGGEALNEEQKADESSKLLRRLDANGDGQMGFDEFVGWFRRTCAAD